MLFYLSTSLLDPLRTKNTAFNTNEAIHRLLEAWFHGDHLILAGADFIEAIVSENLLNERDIRLLKSLGQKLPQMGQLLSFRYSIEVVGHDSLYEYIETERGRIIRLGYAYFLNTHITDQAMLLVENMTDATLYEKIAQSFLVGNRQNIRFSYLPVTGGGGAIFNAYSTYQNNADRLCLCFVDSDKGYPTDSVGGTATKLRQVHEVNVNNHLGTLCNFYILKVREIENLIPTGILMQILEKNDNRKPFVDWLMHIEERQPESRFFADIKEGFSLKKVILKENCRSYWMGVLGDEIPPCKGLLSGTCPDNECQCLEISGMGDRTLSNAMKMIESMTPQEFNETTKYNPELKDLWNEIGELFMCWFCAGKPTYVN